MSLCVYFVHERVLVVSADGVCMFILMPIMITNVRVKYKMASLPLIKKREIVLKKNLRDLSAFL